MAVNDKEPDTYEAALASDDSLEWKKAMIDEMNSLSKNNTWKLVSLPVNKNIIDNRWIFKYKYDERGNINRHRARLVMRGFSQKYGIDYNETFSPVVKFDSISMIIAMAAIFKMEMIHFDIKTAFLYGELKEEIYTNQPKGFADQSGKVCKLIKSLYGLKQSARCWNQKFSLTQSNADQCVFYKMNGNEKIIIAIFVDDGLVASTNQTIIKDLISYLEREFEISVTNFKLFLGIQAHLLADGLIFMNQENYTNK